MQNKKDSSESRNKQLAIHNSSVLGKIPPQNIEIEEALIGTILMSPNSIITIIDLFKPEVFYRDSNQKIAEAILKLHQSNRKVDVNTVAEELRRSGDLEMIGGSYHLILLLEKTTNDSLGDYMKVVYQYFISREIIRISTEAISKAYELIDPFEIIADTSNQLDIIQRETDTRTEVSTRELAMEAINYRENNKEEKRFLGLSTGSYTLDKAIGGFQETHFIVIAGRPAMGKTAYALSVLKAIGKSVKAPVAMFSLEMDGQQLYTRLQASEAHVDSKRIRYNKLTDDERIKLFKADGDLAECPIYIDDTPALEIDKFMAKAAIMKHKYGLKAIIIDYLQLMKSPKKEHMGREAEISDISGKLKRTAKKLKIPIIALSQLSREVEKRAGLKIPQLSDLRDSGSIEQDADIVLFLWRPEYYNIKQSVEFTFFNKELSSKDLLGVVIAKQREGETYILPLEIKLATMEINDHPELMQVDAPF